MIFLSQIILRNLASCYSLYKDYTKASQYFSTLVDLQPDNEAVIADYGRVLAMSGKVDEAKGQLRNALKIAEMKNQEQLLEQVCFFLCLIEWQESVSPESVKFCHHPLHTRLDEAGKQCFRHVRSPVTLSLKLQKLCFLNRTVIRIL